MQKMFENLQKELERLGRMTEISVPIEADSEGYFDKECPSEPCLFLFKIHGDDWSNIVRDEEVFCPSCGHVAPAKSWYPRAQVEAARNYALGTITNSMNKAMRADAAASKRRQDRNSFLSITLDVKGGRDAVLVPVSAAGAVATAYYLRELWLPLLICWSGIFLSELWSELSEPYFRADLEHNSYLCWTW